MGTRRTEEMKALWDFAFGGTPSDEAVNRLTSWAQAFGEAPVYRAIERSSFNATDDEEEALEEIRLTLRLWKSKGWL